MNYQFTLFVLSREIWVRTTDLEHTSLLSQNPQRAPLNSQIQSQAAHNPSAPPMPHLSKLPLKDWSEKKNRSGMFSGLLYSSQSPARCPELRQTVQSDRSTLPTELHAGHLCNTSPRVLWMPQHCWAVTSVFHTETASWCLVKQVLELLN